MQNMQGIGAEKHNNGSFTMGACVFWHKLENTCGYDQQPFITRDNRFRVGLISNRD
jgi:hypothetical protein